MDTRRCNSLSEPPGSCFPQVSASCLDWPALSDHRPVLFRLECTPSYEWKPAPHSPRINRQIFTTLTETLPEHHADFSLAIAVALEQATFYDAIEDTTWLQVTNEFLAAKQELKHAKRLRDKGQMTTATFNEHLNAFAIAKRESLRWKRLEIAKVCATDPWWAISKLILQNPCKCETKELAIQGS
jgi:hypothetical protein